MLAGGTKTEPELWLAHDGAGIDRFTHGYVQFWRGEVEAARDAFSEVHVAPGTGYPDVARLMLTYAIVTLGDLAQILRADAAVAGIPDTEQHGVPWAQFKLGGRIRLAEERGDADRALELAATLRAGSYMPTVTVLTAGVCRRLGEPVLARSMAEMGPTADTQPYARFTRC